MYKILDFKSNIMCKNRRFKKIILHFIKKKVYKLILPLHKILGTYINKPPTKNTKKPHPPTKSLNTTSHNNNNVMDKDKRYYKTHARAERYNIIQTKSIGFNNRDIFHPNTKYNPTPYYMVWNTSKKPQKRLI